MCIRDSLLTIEKLKSENDILKDKCNSIHSHTNEEANSYEETSCSEHSEKKAFEVKELAHKIALLETEQEKYKRLIAESNQKLEDETKSHREQLMKFKDDYCRVFQEMNLLKKALKAAQDSNSLKSLCEAMHSRNQSNHIPSQYIHIV
eukprot:TRINITY_DN11675_c0_g1_i15.p1 TRINITY_DN11675_c0_g1~~TRINITY_DN11675_c0_g1_i15.p1  ORF type:complete len:148 (-),score=30.79 TRINITY_DN11675_c0_g1_i15:95-538(-)